MLLGVTIPHAPTQMVQCKAKSPSRWEEILLHLGSQQAIWSEVRVGPLCDVEWMWAVHYTPSFRSDEIEIQRGVDFRGRDQGQTDLLSCYLPFIRYQTDVTSFTDQCRLMSVYNRDTPANNKNLDSLFDLISFFIKEIDISILSITDVTTLKLDTLILPQKSLFWGDNQM